MRYERMSRADLIAELRARDSLAVVTEDVVRLATELGTHKAELQAQHEALAEMNKLLETSRDKYADLYDFAPIAYVTLSASGVVEEINLTGAGLLGNIRSRILHIPFHVYVAKEHRRAFLDFLRSCRRESGPSSIELHIQTSRGVAIPAQLACQRCASPTATGVSLRVAITDLTKIKEAEAEREKILRKEQEARAANDAKDRFLAMLSHELRTPLTPILYATQALEAARGLPTEVRSTVEMIRRNTELEARLIDDLLDVTRIARGKVYLGREIIDVHALVGDVMEICESELRAADLEAVVALDAERHHVDGDLMRLRQVLWNLLRNAIKATPPGGRVTVRSFNEARGKVTVVVSDTGVGIEADVLEHIFRPFEQTGPAERRSGGLGLGLTIAKGLVEAHGGSVHATSAGAGRGASFEVQLGTVAPPQQTKAEETAGSAVAPRMRRGMRILVVEDHQDTATMLSMLLDEQGHRTCVAHSVSEALALAGEPWDVLLTDLGLPDGSGLEVVRGLRAGGPLKAIALSGYGRDEDVRASLDAGCQSHLTKPINFVELVETLERMTMG